MSDLYLPDNRLEMPELMYAGVKPIGNVCIDKNSAFAPSYGFWMMDDLNPINLVTGTKSESGNSNVITYDGIRLTGSGVDTFIDLNIERSIPQNFSIVANVEVTSLNDHAIFDLATSGLTSQAFLVWIDVNGSDLRLAVYAGAVAYSANITASLLNTRSIIGVSVDGVANTVSCFLNGETLFSNIAIGTQDWSPTVTAIVGNKVTKDTAKDMTGYYRSLWVDEKTRSDIDMIKITENPYQFLIAA